MKNKLGKLIVFEGLDCSGKTTAINNLLKQNNKNFIYNKGIGTKTRLGKICGRFPCTLLFSIELLIGIYIE